MKAPEFSDQAMALECAQRFGDNWRYVADTGQWHRWNGTFWEVDKRNAITEPITAVCCENAVRAIGQEGEKLARALASDARNRAVLSRLSCDQRIVLTHDQLDARKHLIGTPAGFVDLQTGKSYPPERGRLITMSTATEPAPPGVECYEFKRFLNSTYPQVPGSAEPNDELIQFLQDFLGYALTGEVREHLLVFLLGPGGNGKGVLTHLVQSIVKNYGTVMNAESLMERGFEPHRSEFAVLRGKRLICCREVPPGAFWNYSKLMGLVAGDPMQANFMRRNPFTFHPCGKLIIESNNRPAFRVVTPAVERRFALIRHEMRFLRKDKLDALFEKHSELKADPKIVEADLGLKDRLENEGSAILRWMIDGAVRWYRNGLRIPNSVLADSTEYLEEQDDEGAWIRECCQRVVGGGMARKDAYESFTLWCWGRGQKAITYREFGNHLRDIQGFKIAHQGYGDQVVGLALNDFARTALLRHREEKRHRGNHSDSEGNAGDG